MSGDNFMLDLDTDDFLHEEWLNDFDFELGEDMPFGRWRLHEWQDDDEDWHGGEDEGEDKDGEVKTNAGASGALGVGVRALF